MSDDEDLADDLRIYGSCFWKMVDGKRVRVPMEKVQYINGEAMEIGGSIKSSHTERYDRQQGLFV